MNETKNLMSELINRIYVFTYKIMEDDQYEILYEDGVPLKLTEEELMWFAEKKKEGFFDKHMSINSMPEWLRKNLSDGISDEAEEIVQNHIDETGFDEFSVIFDFMPVELELALNEITGQKSKDDDYYFNADVYEFEDEYMPATIPFMVNKKGMNLRVPKRLNSAMKQIEDKSV